MCFQLPALLLDGCAIVVSPLIALMKNQVDVLRGYYQNESIAHVLNSSLNIVTFWEFTSGRNINMLFGYILTLISTIASNIIFKIRFFFIMLCLFLYTIIIMHLILKSNLTLFTYFKFICFILRIEGKQKNDSVQYCHSTGEYFLVFVGKSNSPKWVFSEIFFCARFFDLFFKCSYKYIYIFIWNMRN